MDGCFLCAPDRALVYAESASAFALSGLGPIVDGYSLIATRAHIRSYADAPPDPGLLPFAESVRDKLITRYGSCVMTEHGRLPVCARPTGTEEHCFHAHFLLFPAAPNIVEVSRAHFEYADTAPSIDAALRIARELDEYFLVSLNPTEFLVMSRPRQIMRQFARYMIADAIGKPDLADWVSQPERPRAELDAAELRQLMPEHLRMPWKQQK